MKRASMNQQGFTLIEVLVALALMALLSIISWRALDVLERSSERLNASADDTLALVRVLGQLESDISSHAAMAIVPPLPETAGNEPVAPAGVVLPSGITWSAPVLTVVRTAHEAAWQQVAWGYVDNTLRRAVGPASSVLPLPEPGPGQIVLEDVDDFSVRAWIPGQGWSALSATGQQLAATGMEITIQRRHQGVDETYRKVVMLP